MARLLETDSLSNQNITSALAIGAYTATATRMLFIRVLADQVAGNGDYVVYATLQVGGAGSAYRLIPITTAAAASGVTAIGAISIGIPVDSGDVVTVYLTGLAGDNANPDTRVDFYENDYLRPTTAGRRLDVSATGEAGLDFDNIKAATAPTTLTNITVPTVTTLTNGVSVAAGGIVANSFGLSAITEDAIAPDSITSSELAASAVQEIADQVWDELIAGHAGAGSAGATLSGLVPGAATTLNAEITEIHVT